MGNSSLKQLEAEVIDVRDDTVLVHYNGWAPRWDEWLQMNSNRIAPFRTYTVPSAYSMFMSPNPSQALDGFREGRLVSDPRQQTGPGSLSSRSDGGYDRPHELRLIQDDKTSNREAAARRPHEDDRVVQSQEQGEGRQVLSEGQEPAAR